MKRLFNYILLLFTALMIGNQVLANSTKAQNLLSSTETKIQDPTSLVFEFESITDFKQPFFVQKDIKDKIEVSESENETEDSQNTALTGTFNFLETYLPTYASGNLSTQIQNGLAPSKHILYLATIRSFCIIFCVYRI